MKNTSCNRWNGGANKDTFWNLAVLLGFFVSLIASAVDLPQDASIYVAHVAYQQTAAAR